MALLELLELLDGTYWERGLVHVLREMKDELIKQMEITEQLTNESKGNRKSLYEHEKGRECFEVDAFIWNNAVCSAQCFI